MEYIMNEGSKNDIERIKLLLIKNKIVEQGCILDIMLGEYDQLLINLYNMIIIQWINKKAAKPIIAIGENENERLAQYLRDIATTTRIEVRTIISYSKKKDGSISLEDFTRIKLDGVCMAILSPESGSLGIANDYKKIYEYCHSNGIMLFSDLTSRVERRSQFKCHIGLAELGCIGGPAGYHILYINKFIAELLGPNIHIYSNNNFMNVGAIALFLLNVHKKNAKKTVKFEDDDKDQIKILKVTESELDAADTRFKAFQVFLRTNKIIIVRYSTFIEKRQSKCLICCSSFDNQFGDYEPGVSLAFVKDEQVYSRDAISEYMKSLISQNRPVPVIRFSQIITDSYKSNAIYFSFLQNTSIDALCELTLKLVA